MYPSWFALDTNAREHFCPRFCGDAGRCPPCWLVMQRQQIGAFQKHNLRVHHAAEGNRGLRLVRISTWRSKVQSGQPCSVQQHDLPLGLAEEPEDPLAVKM